MKLADFITANIEEILVEWDGFAKSIFPVEPAATDLMLRDHAREILEELALDIETNQTDQEQTEKSKGQPADEVDRRSAAGVHGSLRHGSGFTLIQLTSEYRALRATVFRLWMPQMEPATHDVLADMTRFNEAIDQALAESVLTYSETADRTRDTFLAILGHDLRSPLFTVSMAGSYFSRLASSNDTTRAMGARVSRSAANMSAMINDLLEYARVQLGGLIPLMPTLQDAHQICFAAMEDAQAGHPDCLFMLESSGDTYGYFDEHRLQQVFSNLLNNAAQYRSATDPVTITVRGEGTEIVVHVRNMGPVIPEQSLQAIFDPLVQLSPKQGQNGAPAGSIGLGLFIAREITVAHGGIVSADSSKESGTVFTVTLPRKQSV
ncbi:MAG: putative two-component sensor histidine kinase [Polaromonas sp.]|nr:putative two-component sensor histidine kinase [Polaromonas sp.]